MSYSLYKLTIAPQSHLVTPLVGDTLFGQLCWALRHLLGNAQLCSLLDGYTQGQPFAVLSDAFPKGYIPRPTLPLARLGYDLVDAKARKNIKKRQWIAVGDTQQTLQKALSTWSEYSYTEQETLAKDVQNGLQKSDWKINVSQSHNSLNRLTNTTTKGEGFAPFSRDTQYFHPQAQFDIYVVLDTTKLELDMLQQALGYIGQFGYGKEASTGAGKFRIESVQQVEFTAHTQANAHLTLANSAPQGQTWQAESCFYQTTVRFGRHGDAAVYMGNPFKNPILMAQAGAVLTPQQFEPKKLFIGQGIGQLSKVYPETVHQGYAPVLPIYLD